MLHKNHQESVDPLTHPWSIERESIRIPSEDGRLDEEKFWEFISLFDWSQTGDDDAVMAGALQALAAMDREAIYRFEDILAEKLHALDTREHCRACYAGELDPDDGDDYISADDFLYQRCVVVVNGREVYEAILKDPSQMPQGMEFEALLSLPSEAFEEKTGEEYDHVPPVSYESFENTAGWAPTSDTRGGKYTGPNIPPGNRRPT